MEEHKYTDAMFDVETLGRDGKFVVTEVSIIPFNIEDKDVVFSSLEENAFTSKINIKDSLEKGFNINPDTIKWWIQTDVSLFKQQLDGGTSIEAFCELLKGYLSNYPDIKRFWATATLDYQAISNLFNTCNQPSPILYNQRMCARTLNMLASDFLNGDVAAKKMNDHNSIKDCLNQIQELVENYHLMKNKFI